MFKTSRLISVLCDYSDAYIVVKGRKFVEEDNDDKTRNKNLSLKIMLHLDHAYQKQ